MSTGHTTNWAGLNGSGAVPQSAAFEVEPVMKGTTFTKIRDLVYKQVGITLGPQKEELVKSRIGKRMRNLRIAKYDDYYNYLTANSEEMTEFLDAISTNTTHFFRESHHFDVLNDFLESAARKGQRRFRIWSAASSSGEEPYSIAVTALEALSGIRDVDLRILATDISTQMLRKCVEGVYPEKQFMDMPKPFLLKYFTKQGDSYRANDILRRPISFNRINLSIHPFPMKGPFDIVFCRNVMIYFDSQVRAELLMDIHRLLSPEGLLMVGHAESLTSLQLPYRSISPAVYKKA